MHRSSNSEQFNVVDIFLSSLFNFPLHFNLILYLYELPTHIHLIFPHQSNSIPKPTPHPQQQCASHPPLLLMASLARSATVQARSRTPHTSHKPTDTPTQQAPSAPPPARARVYMAANPRDTLKPEPWAMSIKITEEADLAGVDEPTMPAYASQVTTTRSFLSMLMEHSPKIRDGTHVMLTSSPGMRR